MSANSQTAPNGAAETAAQSSVSKEPAKPAAADSEKKELTGAQKKAAAKAEKAARRAAKAGEGDSKTASEASAVNGQPKEQQQSQQRKPSIAAGKQPAQQLPTRNRRPSNTPATSAPPAKPKAQKTKQLAFLSHLYSARRRPTAAQLKHPPTHRDIHPSIQTLALHLESYKICGSQARTIGLLLALKAVIRGYNTPQGTSLPRHLSSQGLSAQLNHIKSHGRPFCTSQGNAVRWLKNKIVTLDPSIPEPTAINSILSSIDVFIREKFTIADKVIAQAVAGEESKTEGSNAERKLSSDPIEDGDEVLVFSKSAVVCASLREAAKRGKRFSVLCVDAGRPLYEGRTMSKTLATLKVPSDQTSEDQSQNPASRKGGITSLSYIPLSQLHAHLMQSPVNRALMAANSVYSNGAVLSRAGQAQTALAVKTECPGATVYVLAETIKFTERAVLGSGSLNVAELAPESELIAHDEGDERRRPADEKSDEVSSEGVGKDALDNRAVGHGLKGWEEKDNLFLMNLLHDVTPPDLIDAIITEVGTVPPTTAAAVGRMVGVGGELGEV